MKTGGVVALVIVAGCVGVLVGSFLQGDGADVAGPATPEVNSENRRKESEIADLRVERDRATERATAAEERARIADEKLAASRAELESRHPGDAAVAAPEKPGEEKAGSNGPRFFAGAYEGALTKVNWTVVGKNMGEMLTLVPGIATALLEGKDPSAEAIGRIQQLNGPLVAAALKLQEGVPGVGVNGRFSDPSFMVNAMAMSLEVAGLPLRPDQAEAIETTAASWMAKDLQRRQGYDDRTWLIQKIYEEAELKDGFFRDAFAILTAEQAGTLSPDSVKGRVRLDMFSSSLIYAALARVDFFSSREDLVEDTLRGASAAMRLKEEERAQAKPIVADWVDRLPAEIMAHETNGLDVHGLVHTNLVTTAARQQHALVKSLVEGLGLEGERLDRIRNYGLIHTPLPNRKTPETE